MTEADRRDGLLYAILLAVVGGTTAVVGGYAFAPVGSLLLVAALGYGTVVFFWPFAPVDGENPDDDERAVDDD